MYNTQIHPVFAAARRAWESAADLRTRRLRFKNYTYGRQWDDPVRTPAGHYKTEGEYAEESGKHPLTNNMIRQLVKSVVRRFRHNLRSSAVPASETLRGAYALNNIGELDARMLEEFLRVCLNLNSF